MKIVYRKVSSLIPYEFNNKIHPEDQIDAIANSIREFWFTQPIVIDLSNIIVIGEGRRKGAKKLWMEKVPCLIAEDLTDAQIKKLRILDNKLNESERNFDNIKIDLLDIGGDFAEQYFPDLDLDIEWWSWAASVDDSVEDAKEIKTDIKLWDVIEIGEHRLVCGDSTDKKSVESLMNGERAEIAFTSPPYNAGTTPTEVKAGKKSKYANDNDNKSDDDYLRLLINFTINTLLFCDYSFVNIQSLSGNKIALIDFLYKMKLVYADTMIREKQTAQPAMAENVLNSQFEYIHIFSHKANRAIGAKRFRGTLSNVVDISKQNNNEVKEHNATFPLTFATHFIHNFCNTSVLDLFLWSGTTMVAAQQLWKKCYGMELDPKYCQVIVNRMIKNFPEITVRINCKDYLPS